MKNLIILTAILFGLNATSYAQTEKVTLSTEAQAKISLEKKSHDFGTIEEGVQAT